MNNKWDEFQITPSKKFGYEVTMYTPSIFREFRGEIFTTFHSEKHPSLEQIHYDLSEINVHDKFSKSYKITNSYKQNLLLLEPVKVLYFIYK